MTVTNPPSILVIGAGNMGASMANGLIADHWPADLFTFCEQQPSRHAALAQMFPASQIITSAQDLSHAPGVVLLAVKPNDMAAVCQSLATLESLRPALFISIAAGVPLSAYQRWLGDDIKIIRCMPNTPASIGQAMTGLYTPAETSSSDRQLAEQILGAIGQTLWVENESMLDAVTAVSGSGPAYFFYLMECMQKSAEALGLSPQQSYTLTLQTMLGAAQLADHQNISFETLRTMVTSKGGTTEQAINCFTQRDLPAIVDDALQVAATRAHEISQSFAKE